eukprot:CFRG5596T1
MSLPESRGRYNIAVADLESKTDRKHGTQMRLWYPCDLRERTFKNVKATRLPKWLPHPHYAKGYASFLSWPTFFAAPFLRMMLGSVVISAECDAPLVSANVETDNDAEKVPERFPVMMFSHGLGGNRTSYSYYCAEIASQGFVVASIEHRDGTASTAMLHDGPLFYQGVDKTNFETEINARNRQLQHRIEEVKQALNVMEHLEKGEDLECVQREGIKFSHASSMVGRLDFSRCVMAGHSFGGITALQSAAVDRRFTACVVQDAWMIPGDKNFGPNFPSIPRLFINTEKFQWKDNMDKQLLVMEGKDSMYAKDNSRMIAILNSLHQNQSDLPLLYPTLCKKMGMAGTIDAVKAEHICIDATLVFLAKYYKTNVVKKTKDAVEATLNGGEPSEIYTEMVFGSTPQPK